MRTVFRLALFLSLAVAGLAALAAGPDSGRAADEDLDIGIVFQSEGVAPSVFDGTVEITRGRVAWLNVQKSCADIRQNDYAWDRTDRIVTRYLEADAPVLMTVRASPACASEKLRGERRQPKRSYWDDFAKFTVKVAERYGPEGSVTQDVGSPYGVTKIEAWNEPNIQNSWVKPSGKEYGRFLGVVSKKFKRSDATDGIDLLVGGLAASNAPEFTKELYEVKGVKNYFDGLGLHTYTPSPKASLKVVSKVRRAMKKGRDKAPITVSEHGWSTCAKPSATKNRGKCTTRSGQASKLRGYVRGLGSKRSLNVDAFLWYTPQDVAKPSNKRNCPREPKYYYGFFDLQGEAKPSWDVWQNLVGGTGPTELEPVPADERLGCTKN